MMYGGNRIYDALTKWHNKDKKISHAVGICDRREVHSIILSFVFFYLY